MSTQNPSSYTEAREALDEIGTETANHIATKDAAIARLRVVQTDLLAMQSKWDTAKTYIEAQTAAAPADADWARLDSELAKIVADFVAAKASLDAVIAAIDSV